MGNLGSAMIPGRVDKKYVALLGLVNQPTAEKFMLPVGTFLLSSSNGDKQAGKITQGAHLYDIVREFNFEVNDDFPHTLYGQQDSGINPRYDPAYNLICQDPVSGGGNQQTWQCDAVAFMTQASDNVFFSSDFQSLFAYTGNNGGVNVYSNHYGGNKGEFGLVPIPFGDSVWGYNWDAARGIVNFTNPHTQSDLIISVDGKPQGMSPENMLKHLFVDYAGYSEDYLMWLSPDNPNPQVSNVILPTYVGGRDKTIWAIGQDIANMTAPRMVQYVLKVNELGQILFYENRTTASPSEILIDTRDILDFSWTFTDEQIYNVVRGDSRSNDNQPLTSLAYDIQSITDNGERQAYDIPEELLLTTRGMNSYYGISFMNMMTASILFQNSQPILQLTLDVLPNPMRQCGDKVQIMSSVTGKLSVYVIKGITDTISKGQYKQQMRLQKARLFNNFAMGMPTALTNDKFQQQADTNATALAGQTGLVSHITIGGIKCFDGGQQLFDSNGDPILSIVNGASWDFEYGIQKTEAYDTYVWRYWYLEGGNSLSSSDLMVIREHDWVNNDGTKISHQDINHGWTDSTSHTTGPGQGTGTAYLRSNVIVAPSPEMLPDGYNADLTTITFVGPTNLGTSSTGLGLGTPFTGGYTFFPNQKYNYGYFCLLLVNAQGAVQFINMPFILEL